MMGESLEEHDEMSMSALGEIANMISGNAAANLYEQGFTCEISPPQFSSGGSEIKDEFPGTQIIAAFTSELGQLNIRIGLAETSPETEAAKAPKNVEADADGVDPRFAMYTGRIKDVMGYMPPKKRY